MLGIYILSAITLTGLIFLLYCLCGFYRAEHPRVKKLGKSIQQETNRIAKLRKEGKVVQFPIRKKEMERSEFKGHLIAMLALIIATASTAVLCSSGLSNPAVFPFLQ